MIVNQVVSGGELDIAFAIDTGAGVGYVTDIRRSRDIYRYCILVNNRVISFLCI